MGYFLLDGQNVLREHSYVVLLSSMLFSLKSSCKREDAGSEVLALKHGYVNYCVCDLKTITS